MRRPGFARVLVVLFGVGVVLGTIEVVAPAVAVGDHHRGASGWLLAAMSLGSALGGLAYGHASWRSALGSRMLFAAALEQWGWELARDPEGMRHWQPRPLNPGQRDRIRTGERHLPPPPAPDGAGRLSASG